MVCCKIILPLTGGSFSKLCSGLGDHGGVLVVGPNVFFGTVEEEYTDKTVRALLRRSGYREFILECYDKDNQPDSEEDVVRGWLTDWLVRMEAKHVQDVSQDKFKELAMKMDALEKEIDSRKAKEGSNG